MSESYRDQLSLVRMMPTEDSARWWTFTYNDRMALAAVLQRHDALLAACKALQMEAAARGCGLRIADEAIQLAEGTP